MLYKIVSDSAANLRVTNSEIPFEIVPLTIRAGEKEFVDDNSLNVSEMVAYMKSYKGKSGTACPSVDDYVRAFGEAQFVFCVTITSGLSGSFNAARLAKEDYESMYPERKVCILDSLSAGPEMNMIIEKLQDLIAQGRDYNTICKEIAQYQQKTGLMFSLESLKNLANNGRVNPMVARLAGTLGICIVGRASDKGELEQMSKCRGEKKALITLFKHMCELGYNGGKVHIDHCENQTAAELLRAQILQTYPEADIKIGTTFGLCSFYAEIGGLMVGFEKE